MDAVAYQHVLLDDEKRELLRIARATLREHCYSGRIPPGKPHRECLVADAAVFVTLHRGDSLRGCVGMQQAVKPLYRAIQEMAVAAATRDPRFKAIEEEELDQVTIEISVLGPRQPVRTPAEIVIGTHGLSIEVAGAHGLLLPQVAIEARWSPSTFLEKVCSKAGLAADAWSVPEAQVEVFTAQVFNEKAYPPKPRS